MPERSPQQIAPWRESFAPPACTHPCNSIHCLLFGFTLHVHPDKMMAIFPLARKPQNFCCHGGDTSNPNYKPYVCSDIPALYAVSLVSKYNISCGFHGKNHCIWTGRLLSAWCWSTPSGQRPWPRASVATFPASSALLVMLLCGPNFRRVTTVARRVVPD
ncbi:unnamed protein product [Ostreobium quekettii]|uniref:Uncharacterized protein n=1 Tax=Ostreobium quekettii TaxID=121088 RepID=A0A8S1IYJ0_9CHLO|nr:unnamed protein product [Ostreobium quekettii]